MKQSLVPTALAPALLVLAGCPGPQRPQPAAVAAVTLDTEGPVRGVASDGTLVVVARDAEDDRTIVEARRGGASAWGAVLAGRGGPIAWTGSTLAVALGGTGSVGVKGAEVVLHGDPGAAIVALDTASGGKTVRWTRALDASEWALVASLAPVGDDLVVGGSFSGTLRLGDRVVSSAGKSDGFVARLSAGGDVRWLVRAGGANADAITGVAAAGAGKTERIAIAGTFTAGAELLGTPLLATDDRSLKADVFVAELDGAGRRRWSASFGGALDDSAAGVAIDGRGRLAVATTARESLRVGHADLTARGPADGLVTFFDRDGTAEVTVVLGGPALDGTRAIAASGDHVVVAGFYSGELTAGRESLRATGGDDAYLAVLDGGTVVRLLPIAGPGREEVAALAGVPGGFVAAIAHTAGATVDGATLPSPADPMTGAAIVVRPAR